MRWVKPALALVAVALALWQVRLLLAGLSEGRAIPAVETAIVRKGPFLVGISREGMLKSAQVAHVRAPESGSTLTWVIEDGTRVNEGELIAKVDVSEYQFRVNTQRLSYESRLAQVAQERRNRSRDLESAKMQVDKTLRGLGILTESQTVETEQAQAQINYDDWNLKWAQTDYDKQEGLLDEGIVAAHAVELAEKKVRSREYALTKSEKEEGYLGAKHSSNQAQTKADIDTAEFEAELANRRIATAVKSAEERAKMTGEDLSKMEEQLASGELRAPRAGVVVLDDTWDRTTFERRAVREGDRVYPRMGIADITDLSDLQVTLRVEESAAGRLKVGQETAVTVVGVSDRQFRGRVKTIGAVARRVMIWEDADARQDQGSFDVTVEVLNPDARLLRPGMKAKVQFVFEKLPGATYVPLAAVQDKLEGQVVYVLGRGGFAARPVKAGKRNDESVVIEKGVRSGERVALTDPTRAEAE